MTSTPPGTGTGTTRRRAFRGLLAVYVLACAGIAWWVVAPQFRDAPMEGDSSAPRGSAPAEPQWKKDTQLVEDPVVGYRASPGRSFELEIAPLGGEKRHITRRHNNLGLIRTEDVHELPGPPRLLLVGDSHLMGVVDNADNAADVLERSLHARAGLERAAVLNASCGYYSLYQDVLRARTLLDELAPRLLVVAVFLGNDFLELEDVGRPHLDDDGRERPTDAAPPPETTSARRRHLGLAGGDLLFWQGLNQACYFELRPERFEAVLAKAKRCIELCEELARGRELGVVFALVPSYDLVFPDRAAEKNEEVAKVVRAGWNGRVRDRFRALLDERGITVVDLVEGFRRDGRDELYASDYHIGVEGHRRLAEALFEPAVAALK